MANISFDGVTKQYPDGYEAVKSMSLDIEDGEFVILVDKAPRERDIAMVFQNYALYPHMSVRGNMGFSLKLHDIDKSEIERRVTEAAGDRSRARRLPDGRGDDARRPGGGHAVRCTSLFQDS